MRKILFVLVFSLMSTSTYLNAWKFEEKTFACSEYHNGFSDNFQLLDLYDKGVFLLVSEDYYGARESFTRILDFQGISEETRGAALWGRVWSNAFLGDHARLVDDLDTITQLIGLNEVCECQSDMNSLAFSGKSYAKSNKNTFLISRKSNQRDFMLVDSGCINTVDNCIVFMKNMCASIKDRGVKTTLGIFIDGLGKKAKDCCIAGGFWEHCVQKMVNTMNRWKLLGIPSDPYWD